MLTLKRRLDATYRLYSVKPTAALIFLTKKVFPLQADVNNVLRRSNRVILSNLTLNFNTFDKKDCLSLFRLEKIDINKVRDVTG